jgi:hypothetical protein
VNKDSSARSLWRATKRDGDGQLATIKTNRHTMEPGKNSEEPILMWEVSFGAIVSATTKDNLLPLCHLTRMATASAAAPLL